jgi:hypothetical protein
MSGWPLTLYGFVLYMLGLIVGLFYSWLHTKAKR